MVYPFQFVWNGVDKNLSKQIGVVVGTRRK